MRQYLLDIEKYNRETAGFSLIEKAIYRALLDEYYYAQAPISADKTRLCRAHNIISGEEKEALAFVLEGYFKLENNQYRHTNTAILLNRAPIDWEPVVRQPIAAIDRPITEQLSLKDDTGKMLTLNEKIQWRRQRFEQEAAKQKKKADKAALRNMAKTQLSSLKKSVGIQGKPCQVTLRQARSGNVHPTRRAEDKAFEHWKNNNYAGEERRQG